MYKTNSWQPTPYATNAAVTEEEYLQMLDVRLTNTERFYKFLEDCNTKGIAYRKGNLFPTLSQLAAYCGVSVSTVYRIAIRKTKKPKAETLTVLLLICCIEISPGKIDPHDLFTERKQRLQDADDWLSGEVADRGSIIEALEKGIKIRKAMLAKKQQCYLDHLRYKQGMRP